jgi:phosphoglycerol transferase
LFNKKITTKSGKQIYPFNFFNNHRNSLSYIILGISILIILGRIGLYDYVYYNLQESSIIEDNYVNPKDVSINFEEKRNLIFILVESLETTLFTKEQNGEWDYEVIPEMYNLLNDKDTVVFYNKDKSQQVNIIDGASWTSASIVSNLSGVPLKVNFKENKNSSKYFMKNIYSLGDLLKDNGYNNEVISGATTSFGKVNEYFNTHGYDVIDVDTLDKYNLKMDKSDIGAWGFNDKYLFEVAKKRLDVLSKKDEPFNLQLITIDTHFIDGFVSDYSETKYKVRYENAYSTTSKLISEFINWLKAQDYYDNTTIVIAGDHLTMQSNIFKDKKTTNRYVYNCIINPRDKVANYNNRIITALDSYPTIVYSIGGNIEGNRLGLGVNLFSNQKTLSEKYNFEYIFKELKKKSKFYDMILSGESR